MWAQKGAIKAPKTSVTTFTLVITTIHAQVFGQVSKHCALYWVIQVGLCKKTNF